MTLLGKLLVLFLFSGATALVYQVVWTRLLTLFFGSTILAVSTVLAVFMGGLAIGSALLGKKADTATEPIRFYGWLELIIGVLAIATPLTFSAIGKLLGSGAGSLRPFHAAPASADHHDGGGAAGPVQGFPQ